MVTISAFLVGLFLVVFALFFALSIVFPHLCDGWAGDAGPIAILTAGSLLCGIWGTVILSISLD
ncbi:MAG TPA: hypothetical protein VMI53_13850, partial [Opitutaceae bacterium]|nr:hypothetical protein [Opitutaceae bacterium]